MMKIFSIVHRSLAWRLVFSIGALMVVSGVLFWYAFIRYENKELMETAVSHAKSYISIAKKTVEFGMLTVHRENIQHNVEAIASLDDVKKVRIFDDKGLVFYSSDKKEIGKTVNKKSEICKTCHSDPEVPQKTLKTHEKWFITDKDGKRYLKFVDPLYNEPTCYNAECHFHPDNKRVLGLMEMDFPLDRVDRTIWNRTWKTISFGIILFCILSLSLLFILWRLVSRPVSALASSMKRVAEGDLDHSVQVRSNDEMATLANNFNFMIQELKKSRDTVNRWTQTLEEEIAKKTDEIQATQRSLAQTEKLASLGRMAAGVAHEINNPLTGIITFALLLKERTPKGNKQDIEDLQIIIEQAERCAKIIKGLLTFSRAAPSEKDVIDLFEVLEKTINMIKTNEKFYNIKFQTPDICPPLQVEGDSLQFQQVFLNMLINAADAMNEKGKLIIECQIVMEDKNKYVQITFTDTGSGIPEENLGKLFDPFFTTKPVGKGTGLGLAVSHGIIKYHGGKILVKSKLGEGTTFIIRVPLKGYGKKKDK